MRRRQAARSATLADPRACAVDEPDPHLLSALTTEHFVLQSAVNATVSEAGARSTLYMMALSSSLVAVGFLAPSEDALMPFLSIVLPTLVLARRVA